MRFKGVVLRENPESLEHRLLAGRRVTVALDDANGREVARLQVVANDYGAFSGAFEIPRDRLPGSYALHTTGNENGRSYLRVEEYKRPTFEVKMGEAKGEGRKAIGSDSSSENGLGESHGLSPFASCLVTGTATTYTDAPVDGAKVAWRVTRAAVRPPWCWWYAPEAPREVARGETTTGADGKFAVTFDAETPPADPRGASPVYHYSVTADVTDTAGETRSGSVTTSVGRTDRLAEIMPDTAPGTFATGVRVTTLDGEPVAGVSGKVTVRRLIPPHVVHRKLLDEGYFVRPYRSRGQTPEPVVTSVESDSDPDAGDLSNPAHWEVGEVVTAANFTTDAKGVAQVFIGETATPVPGHYRIVVETGDSLNRPITARTERRILPETGDRLGLKIPFVAEADTAREYKPGDTFAVRWGTATMTDARSWKSSARPAWRSVFGPKPGAHSPTSASRSPRRIAADSPYPFHRYATTGSTARNSAPTCRGRTKPSRSRGNTSRTN